MTDYDTTINTAESGAAVGIQAEQVHNSTVYQVLTEDPPERKYQVGVRYLDNGVPLRARELIVEAIAQGHDNAEVRFHWALSMLSKRSYREVPAEQRVELASLADDLATYADTDWTRALEAVCGLLEHVDDPDCDSGPALEKLKALPRKQRDKIVRHCDLLLTGSVKDSLWTETRRTAEQGQLADNRGNRVWAYFEPTPAPPRVRPPTPSAATAGDWFRAVLATGVLAVAFGVVGWILLQRPTVLPVIAYLTVLSAGAISARSGFKWRYRTQRRNAKEHDHVGRVNDRDTQEPGFAQRVDHAFRYYSQKYVPKSVDRSVWLTETSGIRTTLRDEMVEVYRESRTSIDRINWLIRYLVRDVRARWENDTLFSYRSRYRTALSTKVWFVSAVVLATPAAWTIIDAAVRTTPPLALGSAFVAIVSGRIATLCWWRILSERRRATEESHECARHREDRQVEFRRWKNKLDTICPTEDEMEAWLECDRALLVDEALRHYRLAWRDIIAHTIVQTPAHTRRRARVNAGPWRYPKYELRLFLITTDGVRELARQLDFKRAQFQGHERGHFRFDAVSSLHVVKSGEYDYTLALTLMNGPARTIDVTEPQRDFEHPHADEPGLSQISLDSTGFTHALHVLEGIAAEGKGWIQRDTSTSHDAIRTPTGNESAA